MSNLTAFFHSQVGLFDEATDFLSAMEKDSFYIEKDADAKAAMGQIRLITTMQAGWRFQYKRIPELNGLMETVRNAHDAVLEEKKADMLEVVRQCLEAIHTLASNDVDAKNAVEKADTFYTQRKEEINKATSITEVEGMVIALTEYKDQTCAQIEAMKAPRNVPAKSGDTDDKQTPPPAKKNYKTVMRAVTFPQKRLESEADVDAYVESLRKSLKMLMRDCDGIQIK